MTNKYKSEVLTEFKSMVKYLETKYTQLKIHYVHIDTTEMMDERSSND